MDYNSETPEQSCLIGNWKIILFKERVIKHTHLWRISLKLSVNKLVIRGQILPETESFLSDTEPPTPVGLKL